LESVKNNFFLARCGRWSTPLISVPRRLRQEDWSSRPAYIERPISKNKTTKKLNKTKQEHIFLLKEIHTTYRENPHDSPMV
jgi:hypothetical protein